MSQRLKMIFTLAAIGMASTASAKVDGPTMLTLDDIGVSEVLAWSWGASQSGSFHVGGGGGAGKANFQDISLTRYTDSLSAAILRAVAIGEIIPNVEMKREGLRIRMQQVMVTSYSVGGMSDKKALQTENISLNFMRVTYEVDGSPAYCFDVALNSPC